MGKDKILDKKRSFLSNIGLFLSAREKIQDNYKSKIFAKKIGIRLQHQNQHQKQKYLIHLN